MDTIYFKVVASNAAWTYGSGPEAPAGAKVMSQALWKKERDAAMSAAAVDVMERIEAMRPVSLFAARKVLRDTKAEDGTSYMDKIKAAHEAGDLSEDAFEAIEMLDPVSRSSPWVAEIQALFELTDEEIDGLFQKARAIQV